MSLPAAAAALVVLDVLRWDCCCWGRQASPSPALLLPLLLVLLALMVGRVLPVVLE